MTPAAPPRRTAADPGPRPAPGRDRRLPAAGPLRGYGEATLGVAVAVAFGHGLTGLAALPNISMVFLMAVLVPALRSGVWPAVFASLLSFLAYNFFFIEPLYTFTVARPPEVLALAVFLVVAVITSALAGRVREEARAAARRVRTTRRLYDFTRRLSALADADDVAEAATAAIGDIVERGTLLLRAGAGGLEIAAAWPPEDRLDPAAAAAAERALAQRRPAGAGSDSGPDVPWLFLPLAAGRGAIGVVGVAQPPGGAPLDAERRTLLSSLVEQTAAAIERVTLAGEIEAARMAAETERVRTMILSSISHDFRTPLASVLGAATSLIELGDRLGPAERADLLAAIRDEALHLDGMVRNLLSMVRLEAGALDLRRDWTDVGEIVERLAAAARRRGAPQAVTTVVAPGLPLVQADPVLIEQALGNVLANAIRYAGPAAAITLSADATADAVRITVEDDGPGIAAAVLPRVFEKFVRGGTGSGDGGEGSGLGLAITRGFVEAHGGSVHAESPAAGGRGTRITIALPGKR